MVKLVKVQYEMIDVEDVEGQMVRIVALSEKDVDTVMNAVDFIEEEIGEGAYAVKVSSNDPGLDDEIHEDEFFGEMNWLYVYIYREGDHCMIESDIRMKVCEVNVGFFVEFGMALQKEGDAI